MGAALRDARFLLALSSPLAPPTGYCIGANWYSFFVFFAAIPLLDWVIGRADAPSAPEERARLERSAFFRAILIAFVPLQLALIVWGARIAGSGELPPLEALGLALSIGLVTGSQGITIAHELGHKSSRLDRWLARLLLVTVSYGHFSVEHNRGHHQRVATAEDPASARFGEGFWRFLPRTLLGSVRHAWALDRKEVAGAWAATLGVAAGLGLAFGPLAVAFFFLQSAMAVTLLEAVNYVEHYGLQRARLADGRYEKVAERHSWDSDHWLTNCFLIHLQRHADHHLNPMRPYAALQPHDGSPQLPLGYGAMVPLAFVPPLWFTVMNPRVPRPAHA